MSISDSPTAGNLNPQFAEPVSVPDPAKFRLKHASDTAAYKILDQEKGQLKPFPFPTVPTVEPLLTLEGTLGAQGARVQQAITSSSKLVFHVVGDTGNTSGPTPENAVTDKMVADFSEADLSDVPSFLYHVGDVVYSFGESAYYYDQFYDEYRNYPAPIVAIPGNHDGMVAPGSTATSLAAFLENFVAAGQPVHRTEEAGMLARTAQIQPAIYFTFDAPPFAKVIGLYSNVLEDPGVISSQSGTYSGISDAQLAFLEAALTRAKDFSGAIIIAVHHPPYAFSGDSSGTKHAGSFEMRQEIDAVCAKTGVWPHAVIAGHAHNYQRFTRTKDGRQIPYIVTGNGGHAHNSLSSLNAPPPRTPLPQPQFSDGADTVVFENYDDQNYGYMRVIVDAAQLRIEYHPASDGAGAKTPDDSVTIGIATRQIIHFTPPAGSG